MTDAEIDWEEFLRKASQLEAEIHKSSATLNQRGDMLHTVSKMRIAASNIFGTLQRVREALPRKGK